jgi:hypothetical protein
MADLTEAQRVERATRAERAIEEFFAPAMAKMQGLFSDRLQEICVSEPWEKEKIVAAAHVVRIVDIMRSDLLTLVRDGEAAANDLIKAEKYEELSPARRRLLSIGPI